MKMRNNHKNKSSRIYFLIPILIALIIFLIYTFSYDIGAKLHPDQTTSDIAELTHMISEQIDQGKTSGVFYLGNEIKTSDLENINEYVVSINGAVDQFTVYDSGHHGKKVEFFYNISDNYYVYQMYKYGTKIPASRPNARKLYEKIISIIDSEIRPGMSDFDKEIALHDYIITHCIYGYVDYANEYAYRAYGCLVQGKAVCNGYAEAFALLLNCVGIDNGFMTGWANDELHAWNRVFIDNSWYQVDVTWDDSIPDRGRFAGHMYFNVTDSIMDDTHRWNKSSYEPCECLDYNYFKKHNMIYDYEGFRQYVNEKARINPYGIVEAVVSDYDADSYDMSKVANVDGVKSFTYSPEPYGDFYIITIKLNDRE